jgi:hypothetical protein
MESRLNKIPLAMIFKRSKDRALLEDILSRVARIESTTNFFYDDLELSRQGINLFALAEQLVLERESEDFKKVFTLNSPKVTVIIPISRKIEIIKVSIQSVLSQIKSSSASKSSPPTSALLSIISSMSILYLSIPPIPPNPLTN